MWALALLGRDQIAGNKQKYDIPANTNMSNKAQIRQTRAEGRYREMISIYQGTPEQRPKCCEERNSMENRDDYFRQNE